MLFIFPSCIIGYTKVTRLYQHILTNVIMTLNWGLLPYFTDSLSQIKLFWKVIVGIRISGFGVGWYFFPQLNTRFNTSERITNCAFSIITLQQERLSAHTISLVLVLAQRGDAEAGGPEWWREDSVSTSTFFLSWYLQQDECGREAVMCEREESANFS